MNEKCSRPTNEYDETEFSQYLFSLDVLEQEMYLITRLCPECFEEIKIKNQVQYNIHNIRGKIEKDGEVAP